MEILWYERGYFGLLGNNYILFIILLYSIKVSRFIGMEQWCQWEDSAGTIVSMENSILVNTVLFIVPDKILW